MKKIEIIITPTGESNVQTSGFSGSECEQASRFLLDSLGNTTFQKHTTEYFHSTVHEQNQVNSNE